MVVSAVNVARTGTVLISRPTIDSAPTTSAGRPDTAVPKATSWRPVNQHNIWAQAACNTVLTVVWHDRANSPSAALVSAGTVKDATSRRPSRSRPASATRAGVSNPANTSPQAASAATLSRSDSQLT